MTIFIFEISFLSQSNMNSQIKEGRRLLEFMTNKYKAFHSLKLDRLFYLSFF